MIDVNEMESRIKSVDYIEYKTSDGQWIAGKEFAIEHEKQLETAKKNKKRKEIMTNTVKEKIELEEYTGEDFFHFKTMEEAEAWDAPGIGKWVKICDPFCDEWGDRDCYYMELERYISIVQNYLDEIKNF